MRNLRIKLLTCGPKVFYYFRYSTVEMKNTVVTALIVLVAIFVLYQYDSTLFGLLGREGFEDAPTSQAMAKSNDMNKDPAGGPAPGASPGAPQKKADEKPAAKPLPGANKEGFADLASYEGPADFASVDAPAGCYPRDQLTPSELLPMDQNSIWAQQNPMGPGSLKGKNFLSAGALIGVNTVGQSLRNANLQIRSEPPNPQIPVSIFLQSTIGPDISHRPLEIGA
jgi:hypothetical protein